MTKFPIYDEERLQTWIKNSGNKKLLSCTISQLKTRYICSRHFTEDSIHKGAERNRLIGRAVPIECQDVQPDEPNVESSQSTMAAEQKVCGAVIESPTDMPTATTAPPKVYYTKCSYQKCKNTTETHSMFRFPVKDPDRADAWILNSGNCEFAALPKEILYKRFLCTDHFDSELIHFAGSRPRLLGVAIPHPCSELAGEEVSEMRETLKVKPPVKCYVPKKIVPKLQEQNSTPVSHFKFEGYMSTSEPDSDTEGGGESSEGISHRAIGKKSQLAQPGSSNPRATTDVMSTMVEDNITDPTRPVMRRLDQLLMMCNGMMRDKNREIITLREQVCILEKRNARLKQSVAQLKLRIKSRKNTPEQDQDTSTDNIEQQSNSETETNVRKRQKSKISEDDNSEGASTNQRSTRPRRLANTIKYAEDVSDSNDETVPRKKTKRQQKVHKKGSKTPEKTTKDLNIRIKTEVDAGDSTSTNAEELTSKNIKEKRQVVNESIQIKTEIQDPEDSETNVEISRTATQVLPINNMDVEHNEGFASKNISTIVVPVTFDENIRIKTEVIEEDDNPESHAAPTTKDTPIFINSSQIKTEVEENEAEEEEEDDIRYAVGMR
ncbi:uncharacterized protein LOC131840700 isoform X2 [Achroia grisella]|uniref:uncharacterized protein LOC131840700 isoform X2 n=1 Tax=Achroia grisella TaxID=688607 RepID=UPI0027D34EAA|nr:uncharacterized protein LOC131840700 isoform X2 [Achroia grisella]